MSLDKLFSRMVEENKVANLDASKKIGKASSRLEAVDAFEKFLKVQPGKYSKNSTLSEKDFITSRYNRGVWIYSPDSSKEIPKELENYVGYYVERLAESKDAILSIYESEIKGKFPKEEKVLKESIEEKYLGKYL